MAEKYDIVCLGSGEAAKFLAWNLSGKLGKRCAVIEKELIGGSCPNTACLPSKNFVFSASIAHELHQAGVYGLGGALAAGADGAKAEMTAVTARKAAMVDGLVEMHLGRFRDFKVELIMATGQFVGPKTIKLDNGRVLTGDHIVICTGSRAKIDTSVPGLVEAKPLTHITLLNLQELPQHLVVLGGGYVGLEFAQAYRRFGSEVTVIEQHDQILNHEDEDVIDALTSILEAEGVKFITSANVAKVTGESGKKLTLTLELPSAGAKTVVATHLLVATGRLPNTENIGLAEAGVQLAPSGHIKVDDKLQTSAEGVFAVGDCAGSPHFTHVAYDDFRVVYSVIAADGSGSASTAGRQVPWTLYTAPELAHVGLRERDAKAEGIKYRVAKLPMAAFLRSRTLGPGESAVGFAKLLVEAEGDKVLGFTAMGPAAGEMLPVVQLAMKLGVSYEEVGKLIIVHPTMCEGLVSLFGAVPPRG